MISAEATAGLFSGLCTVAGALLLHFAPDAGPHFVGGLLIFIGGGLFGGLVQLYVTRLDPR